MVTINYASREISCKIVFYGPGLSGKTTNLQYVHKKVPTQTRGELISLATDTDRTLFFDLLLVLSNQNLYSLLQHHIVPKAFQRNQIFLYQRLRQLNQHKSCLQHLAILIL